MSFECDPCHQVATGRSLVDTGHMFRSYGRCETCGEYAACGECKCSGDWAKARGSASSRRNQE